MAVTNNPLIWGVVSPTKAPVAISGMPISALSTAIEQTQHNTWGNVGFHKFWSSTPRRGGDTTQDVLDIQLGTSRLINHFTLDVAIFPYQCTVQYLQNAKWVNVLDASGNPVVLRESTSVPATITGLVDKQGHQHPFHEVASNHWRHVELEVTPFTSNRFRFMFSRPNVFGVPVDRGNNPVAYPMGVKDLIFSYLVLSKDNLPNGSSVSPDVTTSSDEFTATTDMLGSPISFSIRNSPAKSLIDGSGLAWRSEPQPIAAAVVPLYVDARDGAGKPQVIERIYMEPLYSGGSINIYTSNDEPGGSFSASDDPVYYPLAQIFANVIPGDEGLRLSGLGSSIVIDQNIVPVGAESNWWVGMQLQPQFDSTDTNTYSLFTFNSAVVTVTQGVITMTLPTGASLSVTGSWLTNQRIVLFLGYSTTTGFQMTLYGQDDEFLGGTSLIGSGQSLVVGDQANNVNYRLNAFILKQDTITTAAQDAFSQNPNDYVTFPQFGKDVSGNTQNALVRFSPNYITKGATSTCPSGFHGGPGDYYSTMVWTPVNRDFQLVRGYYTLPPTRCKFVKLEFTNLVAEPYDVFEPITRNVTVFRQDTIQQYLSFQQNSAQANYKWGVLSNTQAAQTARYSDWGASTGVPTKTQNGVYSPTETLYSEDPVVAARLKAINPSFNFQNWQTPTSAVRFVNTQQHVYETVEVSHVSKTAFFVGLKALQIYRVDYAAADDTEQYVELFHDQTNIATSTFSFAQNDLNSVLHTYQCVASSVPFKSTRYVTAIQYATQQTPPLQLLNNPDLDQVSVLGTLDLNDWTAVGDVILSDNSSSPFGSGSRAYVSRYVPGAGSDQIDPQGSGSESGPWTNPNNDFWSIIEGLYPDWDGLVNYSQDGIHPTYNDLSGRPSAPTGLPGVGQVPDVSYVGGIQSAAFYPTSRAGRLYAAARVITNGPLHDSLYLQIIAENDPDGLTPLAEMPITVPNGQITEWYVGYSIGDVVPSSTSVGVRVVQKNATGDSWWVDSLALFEDSIVWEFSNDGGFTFFPANDIKNDPHGVMTFPPAAPGADAAKVGVQLVWRVSAYRPDQHINSVVMRPWYGDLLGSAPIPEVMSLNTPDLTPWDEYSAIEDDPRFKGWRLPVPAEWFYAIRQWLMYSHVGTVPNATPLVSQLVFEDAFVVGE